MTHNPPRPSLIPSSTPLSRFTAAHTYTLVAANTSDLLACSRCFAVFLPLLHSVHLLDSVFPHVYLRLHANSHMALLTALCHTTRHAARRLGVTDAVLQGVRLTVPPVRQIFILANRSAAAREERRGRPLMFCAVRTCT